MDAPNAGRKAAAAVFGAASFLRGKRIFHPRGTGFEGHARLDAPSGLASSAPGSALHDVVVRMSRAAGLPAPFPDLYGIAVKIADAHGPGRDQDLLFATSGRAPVLRNLLVPQIRLTGSHFSTVLPYRADRRVVVFGARGVDESVTLDDVRRRVAGGTVRFQLLVAGLLGEWEPIGEVVLSDTLPDEKSRALRFNPWNTGPHLRPIGPLSRLRDRAYRASQAARARRAAR